MKSLYEFYKLGDKYKSNFDYDGMLKIATNSDISMGDKDLKKLYNSFVDVNYHKEAEHLMMAIDAIEEDDINAAKKHMEQFRQACEKLIESLLNDNQKYIKERALSNIKKSLGSNSSIVENITRDEQYFWAVHADLHDMLIKAANPIKLAKDLYKKIRDKRRKGALDYFLELIKKEATNEHKELGDTFWPLMLITLGDVEKLSNGEEVIIGGFKVKVTDDPDDNTVHAFVDLDEGILFERRIRQTKRMKNSNKVVSATTKELFGPDGKYEAQVKKIFKLFKMEVRQKAKELGVPVGQVRNWKITLKDYDNADVGSKI